MLARVPTLQVAARTSSFAFKDKDVGIQQIGRELGVEHVLEGSVRKSGDQVRITAQLVRASDGFHLWSEVWERRLEDIFAIQNELASDVAGQLEVTLLGVPPPIAPEVDPEAYNLLLHARHLGRVGTRESLESAGELVREALAIDSAYADAWVALGRHALALAGIGALDPAEAERRVLDAARRAMDIDPRNAGSHSVLGTLSAYWKNDHRSAAEHFERTLELDPAVAVGGRAGLRAEGRGGRRLRMAGAGGRAGRRRAA